MMNEWSMGEGVVCSYLRGKLSSLLQEAEGDPSCPSRLISRFRSIERRLNLLSETSLIPIDLLYDLIDQLSECRVFTRKANNLFRLLWFRRKMRRRLDEMEASLTATAPPRSAPSIHNPHRIQQTYPIQDPSLIIGFESEAERIEGWLLRDEIERVGIVGRCGGGKTALAQKVFGSPRIEAEFSPRIWVCLSNMLGEGEEQDPRASRVLNYILEEMGHDVSELDSCGVAQLVEKLQRGLMGRRYLIVLDDMWRLHNWYANVLLARLPRGGGGAVIATGRRENVIRATVGDHKHFIRMEPLLSDQTCWSIFYDVVSRQQQQQDPMPNCLVQMQSEIMENFHGLPLAANTLATIIPNLQFPQSH